MHGLIRSSDWVLHGFCVSFRNVPNLLGFLVDIVVEEKMILTYSGNFCGTWNFLNFSSHFYNLLL